MGAGMADWQFWTLWTVFVFLVVFNFLPAVIAQVDRHPERDTIAMLSLISLFSFALWLALMVWTVRDTRDDDVINCFLSKGYNRQVVHFGVAGILAFGMGSALGAMDYI
jgi:hypothetical protein